MTVIYKKGREISDAQIATNSLVIASEDLVSLSGGFVIKATTTGRIEGVSKTDATFTADNQTVAKEKVTYVTAADDLRLRLTADATITQANVGSFFNLNANQTVDVATLSAVEAIVDTSDAGAAADPVVKFQLELVEVVSSTVGIFKIVR